MMNSFAEKFEQLESEIVGTQRKLDVRSSLKVFYGFTSDKKYRISFISSIPPCELISTEELEVTQGPESEQVFWTCFDLKDEQAKDVFFIFCSSLIDAIEGVENELDALTALKNRYYSWRLLMKSKGKMSYEAYQGLYGELYFLSECLSKACGIEQAVESWVGPDGYSKDFSINDTWYEIKTIGTSSASIKINSLAQLDSNVDGHLITIMVEKMSDQYNSGLCSVPILYRSILSNIANHQLKDKFINKALKYGFADDDETINNYKFEVKKVSSYLVSKEFPKITSKLLKTSAINQVTYSIEISAIEQFLEETK